MSLRRRTVPPCGMMLPRSGVQINRCHGSNPKHTAETDSNGVVCQSSEAAVKGVVDQRKTKISDRGSSPGSVRLVKYLLFLAFYVPCCHLSVSHSERQR